MRELIGLFIDDGWLALGTLAWIALAWAAGAIRLPLPPVAAALLFGGGLALVLAASVLRRARG